MFENWQFLDSPELWKSVAFCISAGLVIFPIYRLLLSFVRKKAEQISSRWEEALKLRREAEELLWQAQQKNFHKDAERKKIVQNALKEARDVKETALGEQKLHFAEKEQEILDRIHTIRQHGLSDLKEKVVSVAVNTTADIFFHSCTKKQSDAFMENGLKELELVLTQNTEKDRLLQAVKND